jgi:carbamoyltransferase
LQLVPINLRFNPLKRHTYILGTGLSHNGSAVLLANGKVVVAIEKERITRIKHDGGNDYEATKYCLEAAGITINDLSLVVQCANFEKESIALTHYGMRRIFPPNYPVPVLTISHHLAHAYSTMANCPFKAGHIFVLDGCGSPYKQCDDIAPVNLSALEILQQPQLMHCEKDSLYAFNENILTPLVKDFSIIGPEQPNDKIKMPTTQHSIGGLYSMISKYCFGNMDDVGKLMGLSPYGKEGVYSFSPFIKADGRVFLNPELADVMTLPATDYNMFKHNFKHYADVACWVQKEVEEAILYTLTHRINLHRITHLSYAGGVALNALANARIKRELGLQQFHIEPAAADNGLALGCAYYGWLHELNQKQPKPDGNTCFGFTYPTAVVEESLAKFANAITVTKHENVAAYTATLLQQQKVIGWFQSGSEFGPRALGRRSILANPFIYGIRDFINKEIKCREDFRPFAPSILEEDVTTYYEHDEVSPYMLLVNTVKPMFEEALDAVVHCNKTSRIQSVKEQDHSLFYNLLQEFKKCSGYGILLNTSFNKKGMPIVETPEDALQFFINSKLDFLIMDHYSIAKKVDNTNAAIMETITEFLQEIGIPTHYTTLTEETFLPGILIDKGTIYIDREKLLYPGDLLHEAGHIAVMMADERVKVRGNVGVVKESAEAGGEEITAIIWSYAALTHLKLDLSVVFHPHGYKGASNWYIEQLEMGNYIGLPLLEWMGLCATGNNALKRNIKPFPHMIKWLRD